MPSMTWDSSPEAAGLLAILWTRARNGKNKLTAQQWDLINRQVLDLYRGDVSKETEDKIREKIQRKVGEMLRGVGHDGWKAIAEEIDAETFKKFVEISQNYKTKSKTSQSSALALGVQNEAPSSSSQTVENSQALSGSLSHQSTGIRSPSKELVLSNAWENIHRPFKTGNKRLKSIRSDRSNDRGIDEVESKNISTSNIQKSFTVMKHPPQISNSYSAAYGHPAPFSDSPSLFDRSFQRREVNIPEIDYSRLTNGQAAGNMDSSIAYEDRIASLEMSQSHGSDQQPVALSQFGNFEQAQYGVKDSSMSDSIYDGHIPRRSVQARSMALQSNRRSPLILSHRKRQHSPEFAPVPYHTMPKEHGKSEPDSFDFAFIQEPHPNIAQFAPIAQRNQLLQESTLSYRPQQPFAESLPFVQVDYERMENIDSLVERRLLGTNGDNLDMMHMAGHKDDTSSTRFTASSTALNFSGEEFGYGSSTMDHGAGYQAHGPVITHADNQQQEHTDDLFDATSLEFTSFFRDAFLEDEDCGTRSFPG